MQKFFKSIMLNMCDPEVGRCMKISEIVREKLSIGKTKARTQTNEKYQGISHWFYFLRT